MAGWREGEKFQHVPIAERFRRAEGMRMLEISPRDIAAEIERFQIAGDEEATRDLFEAYCDWECRGVALRGKEESSEETRARSLKNFDALLRLRDIELLAEGTGPQIARAAQYVFKNSEEYNLPQGALTTFFRQSLNYTPPESHSE